MKIRSDFVSNSSSSSFIVMHSDNKYGIITGGMSPRKLSLREYLDQFGWREICREYWYGDKSQVKMSFVTPQAFAEKFAKSFAWTLPETAKKIWEDLSKCEEDRVRLYDIDAEKRTAEQKAAIRESYDLIEALEKKILDKVEDALKDKYEDEKFDYVEATDNWNGEENEEDDPDFCQCDEDRIRRRIEHIDSLKPLKFYREFCNH